MSRLGKALIYLGVIMIFLLIFSWGGVNSATKNLYSSFFIVFIPGFGLIPYIPLFIIPWVLELNGLYFIGFLARSILITAIIMIIAGGVLAYKYPD